MVTEKLFGNIVYQQYLEEDEDGYRYEFLNYIPVEEADERLFEKGRNQTCAIPGEMYLTSYGKITYAVLPFETGTLTSFERWYPVNEGYNQDLLELLTITGAMKPNAYEIDFSKVSKYIYDVFYTHIEDDTKVKILGVYPQMETYEGDSYEEDIDSFQNYLYSKLEWRQMDEEHIKF